MSELRPCKWERYNLQKSTETKTRYHDTCTGFFHCFSVEDNGGGTMDPCAIVEDENGFVETVSALEYFKFQFADRSSSVR